MTRKEAINSGNKIYSGSPCKHCKSKKKYVSGFSCVKCSIKRNSWKLYDPLIQKYKTPEKTYSRVKKWRENNPDKWQEQWIRRSEKRHIKYENNKESRKDRDLKRTYNITLEEYKILLQKQKEKCAICDKKCKSGKNLAVDHNHISGKIRGLLCSGCNTGIGLFMENIVIFKKAIKYLKENN